MWAPLENVLRAIGTNGSGPSPLRFSRTSHQAHPYYPLEVEIVGYLVNERPVLELLAIFAATCVIVLGSTALLAKRTRSSVTTSDIFTIMWFALCGCIHLFFEGYFSFNHKQMGGLQSIFGQLWKEYSLSDSRYLTQDPFVICMETVTAVAWGPLAFAIAYFITTDHPLRHPLTIVISLGQIYGDVLYFATSLYEHYIFNKSYSRPEAYYFWGYYVLMNSFWILIPGILMYNSIAASARAFAALQKAEQSLKNAKISGSIANTNGAVKKANGAAKH